MSHDVLSKKLDQVLKGVADAQAAATQAEGRIDAMKAEEIKKLAEDSATHLQELQDIKAKQAADEKMIGELEAKFCRVGAPAGESAGIQKEYDRQMTRYLRRNEPIESELIEKASSEIVAKSFYGLTSEESSQYTKTLTAGVNPRGGYWILPDRASQMVKRIFESSPIRQFATVMTTNSDTVELIVDDNETSGGGWVGEVNARPKTDTPNIGKLTIPVHEQYEMPAATQKMIDDAGFDIESWLTEKVTNRMTRTENSAFVVGDGSQKPKGFLTYDAWSSPGVYQRDAIEQINSGTSGAFTADGLIEVQGSLIEDYQSNAIWMVNRKSWASIIQLKDTTDQYLINPLLLHDGTDMTLLGKRLVFANDMPVAAADSLSLAYGDFREGYAVVDRIGFRVLRDDFTDKPNVLFYTTKRTGGAVKNYEAIKLQKLAA